MGTSNDCVSFVNANANANDTIRTEWLAGQALGVSDSLPATVWHLQAPANIVSAKS